MWVSGGIVNKIFLTDLLMQVTALLECFDCFSESIQETLCFKIQPIYCMMTLTRNIIL